MKGQADQDLLGELIPQLRLNCHRADAQAAAYYSLCGLLLRLRNLYKWEQKLPPWREEEPDKMLAWVNRREELWLELDEQGLQPLCLAGRVFDPLDAGGVNALIESTGAVYGAGLAGGRVPAFFLGRLARKRSLDGLLVYELGEEYVPDIFFLPGLRQNQNIFLRKIPLGFLLWDKIADPTASVRRFVDFGLKGYGLSRKELMSRPSWENFTPALDGELQAVLWHELGEAKGDAAAGDLLARILATIP